MAERLKPGKKPGMPKSGGRKKGVPNKINGEIRDMIAGALADAGGQKYLLEQARENPNAFLTLVGKILPKDINANIQGAIDGKWTVEFVNPSNSESK